MGAIDTGLAAAGQLLHWGDQWIGPRNPWARRARRAAEHMPPALREQVTALRLMLDLGVLAEPRRLMEQLRHRAMQARMQKALFFHRYASAVLLAHEVGLFTALRQHAGSAEALAQRLTLHPRAVRQLLRILEAEGLVERRGESFGLSQYASVFLAPEHPFSLEPMLDLMGAQARAFAELPACMHSGATPAALNIFTEDGRYSAFLAAVNSFLDLASRDLLARIELPPVRDFICGSMGVSFSAVLMQRCPDARVTYGCLDHLVQRIPDLRARYGVDPQRVTGMHAHGGEPGDDRWGHEAFDLVFLTKKMILEPDNRMGEKFATKAYQVLNSGGVAILWETVHADDSPTPLPQAMEAVLDLGASPTGPVLTRQGLTAMLTGLGFAAVEFVPCLAGSTTFVIARKA